LKLVIYRQQASDPLTDADLAPANPKGRKNAEPSTEEEGIAVLARQLNWPLGKIFIYQLWRLWSKYPDSVPTKRRSGDAESVEQRKDSSY